MGKPKVISFEGIDGAGKTLMASLFADYLSSMDIEVVLLRDPGSTHLGETLRELLLNKSFTSPWIDVLLFFSARLEGINSKILPALREGKWVILDRFIDATLAYQGYGQGLDVDDIRRIYDIVSYGFYPDLTILLDCPVEIAVERIRNRANEKTRWERLGYDFLERVRDGYRKIASKEPERFVVVDGSKSLEEVFSSIRLAFMEKAKVWDLKKSSDRKEPDC